MLLSMSVYYLSSRLPGILTEGYLLIAANIGEPAARLTVYYLPTGDLLGGDLDLSMYDDKA